jgi:hypothetical protein
MPVTVEGAAAVPVASLAAAGSIVGTFSGAAAVAVSPGILAAGIEVPVVRGAAGVPLEVGIAAAGVDFPTHQKVILNFELAPTRIQYEK